MDKLKWLLSYLKKHEFLAVTALCAALIVIISLGFGVYSLISPAVNEGEEQGVQDGDMSSPGTDQDVPDQACAIDFKDKDFGKAIAAAVKIDYGKLTEQDLRSIKKLSISGNSKIDSLEDLAFLPALEKLTLTKCALSSLDGLSAAQKLKELNLSGNKIKDASELVELTKLEVLNLSSNPLTELPPLAEMKMLKELNLDKTKIREIGFLKDSSIETLRLSYTKLESMDVLEYCTDLQRLYMYGYNEMDLEALQELENFHSIYLSEEFDRSEIKFMADKFMSGDKRTKVYLALEKRGLGANE